MTGDQTSRLQSFVRSTLGCGCPEEVLRSIHLTRIEASIESDTLFTRLDVGGQLLVYVLEVVGDPQRAAAALPAFIASGMVERDSQGFNRLRVVLATDDPEGLQPTAERIFNDSAPRDDRIHLHLVETSELPFE